MPENQDPAKPVLYIDMDNTLVDFPSAFPHVADAVLTEYEGHEDDIPGIFALMQPWPGAIDAVHTLAEHYDVYVLSTAPWANPSAWSDKVSWIQRHFGAQEGSVLYKRLILSHHKNLNRGEFLVDDRLGKNGAERFEGTALEFRSDDWPDWPTVVAHLTAAARAPRETETEQPMTEGKAVRRVAVECDCGWVGCDGYYLADDPAVNR